MKKITTILCLLFVVAATVSAQQLEKLFDKYMEDERFNYVYQKRPSVMDRLNDINEVYSSTVTIYNTSESLGRQMLTLNSADAALEENFSKEVVNALKADKYEQVSIVRNGKNRVEKYEKKTGNRLSKVSFIKNPGNVMVSWNEYETKKK